MSAAYSNFPSFNQLDDSKNPLNHSYGPVFRSIEFNLSTIVAKIERVDELDEEEIKNIIIKQHSMLFNYDLFLKSESSRKLMQTVFTNKRFLSILLNCIGLVQLNREEIVCINKLAYDYYNLKYKDEEVSELLLQISYQINNMLVVRLSSKLGTRGARVLSMIANSSFKDDKNVHRINTFIMKCDISLSIQDIVDIYCILFNRFTYPFIYTMLEYKSSNMDSALEKRFDAISLAILTILDSMTTDDMKKVLYNYGYMLKLVPPNSPVRFSLKTAVGYPRVINAVNEIENDDLEGIKII